MPGQATINTSTKPYLAGTAPGTPYSAAAPSIASVYSGQTTAATGGTGAYNSPAILNTNPPAPAAGATPSPAVTPSPITIKDLYSGAISSSDKQLNDTTSAYGTAAGTPVDEGAIRNGVMNRLQGEIDATNQIYAEKLRQAQITGNNAIGSNTAISARRGLIGSDFGAAADTNIRSNEDSIYAGINAEKAAAIASITDKGNAAAQSEIAAKNQVKQQSASDYISFLAKQEDRRTSRTTDAASRAVAAGIDLSSADAADIKAIADSYQISPDALVSAYTSQKATIDKSRADISKPTGVPASDAAYQYDPKTGKYTKIADANPTDATLKQYQYAVAQGYTGSLSDWKLEQANLKTSIGVQTNPLTGVQTKYQRTGPGVLPSSSGPGSSTAVNTTKSPAPSPGTSSDPYTPASLPTPTSKVQLGYQKDFTTGKTATQNNALNTAIAHVFEANQLYQKVNGGQFPDANAVSQYLKSAAGQADTKNYQLAAGKVADEVSSAYGADTGTERLKEASFGSSLDSPEQHQGYVSTVASLLAGKLTSTVQAYRTAMGANPPSLDLFISPANQLKLEAIGIDVSSLVPELKPSSYAQKLIQGAQHNPKTGQVAIPDGKGGLQILQ